MFVFQKPTALLLLNQVGLIREHSGLNVLCLQELDTESFNSSSVLPDLLSTCSATHGSKFKEKLRFFGLTSKLMLIYRASDFVQEYYEILNGPLRKH